MGNGRRGRQALATPAGDVRHQHVGTKMQLRLVEDQPTARPIAAAMKRPNELAFKDGRRVHVFVEHAIGSLARPRTDAMLEAKFRGQAEVVIGKAKVDATIAACWKLGEAGNVGVVVAAARR